MHPAIAELEALPATATPWTVGSHKVEMMTLYRHNISTEPVTSLHSGADSSMAAQGRTLLEGSPLPVLTSWLHRATKDTLIPGS
jgi:hypothetical protein